MVSKIELIKKKMVSKIEAYNVTDVSTISRSSKSGSLSLPLQNKSPWKITTKSVLFILFFLYVA